MRMLGVHTDFFRVRAESKASDYAEELSPQDLEIRVEQDCLVAFISVEEGDSPESVAGQAVQNIQHRAEQLHTRRIILYPYVHLTDAPGRPLVATRTLELMQTGLEADHEVTTAPFGWYKSFSLSSKGHPLSEWSARFHSTDTEEGRTQGGSDGQTEATGGFVRWVLVDLEGSEYEITPDDYHRSVIFRRKEPVYELLRQLVSNELGSRTTSDHKPVHITYMQHHELVDYCDASEKGHMKWYPKGVLINRLILDYAKDLASSLGAMEMKNPALIRADANKVGELMGEFHERDYQVDGGRGVCYLRYASDPLGFPFMRLVRFSHKQTPFRLYEEATCYRNEQDGEVSGLKRVRGFLMTDFHSACADEAQAFVEFEQLSLRFAELMKALIARDRWVLGWEGTVEFFENNKQYLIDLGRKLGVPAFFKLSKEMKHYYAIKSEFQSINEDGSNIQISTVQWDVKDGQRFDIAYTDESGKSHPCPVIIHASIFGSVERTLCSILENIAIDQKRGVPPMFPYWLSPTQLRIVPVSDTYLGYCLELCRLISAQHVRCDVDDCDDTVAKKIRKAEKEWIPYLLVVGEQEQTGGLFTVRVRKDRSHTELSLNELLSVLGKEQKGMPFRPIPTPIQVSERPVFFG